MYQINCGATTTWERWDALRPDGTVNEDKVSKYSSDNMVSFNHYAFGSVGHFYYAYLLGIHAEAPGFAKLRIQPVIDERIGSVDGSYESGAGLIRSAWKAENGKVEVSVTVPVDTKLVLPVGTYDLKPGSWTSHTVFDKLGSSVTDGSFFKRR